MNRTWALIAGSTLLVQFTLLALTFPLSELFTDTPLFYIDGAMHWYRITAAVGLSHTGNLIGYDPYFGAGVPAGVITNIAAKLPAAMAVLTDPWLSPVQVWKLYSFGASLLAALCVPLALRWLGAGRAALVAGATLGLLLWWVSMFRWFHTAGMVSFVLAAYLGLPYFAALVRYLEGQQGWGRLLLLGALGALGLLIHPLFVVPVAFAMLIWLAVHWRTAQWRRLTALVAVVPLIAALPNLLWLLPMFVDPLTERIQGRTHQSLVDGNLIWREFFGLWQGDAHGSKMYALLAFGALASLLLPDRDGLKKLALVTSAVGLVLVLYSAFGASVYLLAKWTQPNRFAPVAYLWFCLPAAMGLAGLWRVSVTSDGGWQRAATRAAMAVVALGVLVNANELRRELKTSEGAHYGAVPPHVRDLGEDSRFIMNWLANSTTPDARVLFETSNGRIHDAAHMAGYYAVASNREFVGGPYPFRHFAGFWDGFAFNRPVAELNAQAFADYAELYNLGWILVFSPSSKALFDAMPGVLPMAEHGALKAYRIDRPHTWVSGGTGEVAVRGHNRLRFTGLSGDSVTLKYHYMRGLTATPDVPLTPVYLLDDPNPFIRIDNPPAQLELRLAP